MFLFCLKSLLNSFVTDGPDRPTNRPTDGPTEKWLIESRSTRLERKKERKKERNIRIVCSFPKD